MIPHDAVGANAASASVPDPSPSLKDAEADLRPSSHEPTGPSEVLPPESYFEIAGFFLKGKYPTEYLKIEAMDILYFPEPNRRLIPLLTILRAIQVQFSEENEQIRFQFFDENHIIIDPKRKTVRVGDQERGIEALYAAVSEVTQQKDIFLSPEFIATMLSMKIDWDDNEYAFRATTDRALEIWKFVGVSLSEVDEMIVNLPELLSPAEPSRFSLDYLQFESIFRANLDRGENFSQESATLAYMRETLSGNLLDGRYQLRLRQPRFIVDQSGIHYRDSSPFRVEQVRWMHQFSNASMMVGDTGLGFNHLVFPGVGVTGIRINGAVGKSNAEQTPRIIEGRAKIGSIVELYVNNRKFDTKEVIPGINASEGMGRYRFEDINFRTGAINTMRLVVEEPSGVQRVEEKTIYVNPNLVKKNSWRYSTGFGTKRHDDIWDIEARGVFSGAHMDYGVSDTLTVGASVGYQNSIYNNNRLNINDPFDRYYPESSFHVGSSFVWQPFTRAYFSGSLAGSMGGGDASSVDGHAVNLSGTFLPAKDIVLRTRLFRYSDRFFNGNNRYLHGQQGLDVGGRWKFHPAWSMGAALGHIWSDEMDEVIGPLALNYQSVDLRTTRIPRTAVTLSADRVMADWEDDSRILYTLKLVSRPFLDLALEGKFSIGDAISPVDNRNLIRDLNLSGLALFDQPQTSVAVSKTINEQNRVRVGYDERSNGSFREAALLHDFKWKRFPLEVSTRFGYDIAFNTPLFQNLIRYPLGWLGNKSIGLSTRYERNRFTTSLQFNLFELFTTMGNGIQRVSNEWTRRDDTGVKGKVFLDVNANARLDPGEPGVEEVKVLVIGNRNSSLTDRNGYFIVAGLEGIDKVQVALDIDTIPAIYSPTNGKQTAILNKYSLTELNLGLTPVNFIEGHVIFYDPIHEEKEPLGGARVFITRETEDEAIVESYTAGDGSYYLQDIRPGSYVIRVDPNTLPSARYVLKENVHSLTIQPSEEPQEFMLSDFIVIKTPKSTEKKK